jgi:Domain of unknown function (DUF6249)
MKIVVKFLVVAMMITMLKPILAIAEDNKDNVSPYPQIEIQTPATSSASIAAKKSEDETYMNVQKFRTAENVLVPISFFMFLLVLLLGRWYFKEKTHQRKIQLLEKMVEKGQPVSDGVIQQVFSEDRSQRFGKDSPARTIRKGVAFTAIGVGLLIYCLMMHHTGGKLIVGIVFLGLGIGFLVSQRFEKNEVESIDRK